MNRLLWSLVALGTVLPLAACKTRSASPSSIPIEVLYRDNQCRADTAGVVLMNNAEALAEWWKPLAAMSLPARALPAPLGQLDWSDTSAVAISAGSLPTAGYSLDIVGDTARVEDGTLVVKIQLEGPPPGAMVAQVLTSPCVVIAAAKDGYAAVRVIDIKGKLFAASD